MNSRIKELTEFAEDFQKKIKTSQNSFNDSDYENYTSHREKIYKSQNINLHSEENTPKIKKKILKLKLVKKILIYNFRMTIFLINQLHGNQIIK